MKELGRAFLDFCKGACDFWRRLCHASRLFKGKLLKRGSGQRGRSYGLLRNRAMYTRYYCSEYFYFIGYKRKGVPGGFAATFGFVFPSLVIITIIAAFLQNFAHISYVAHAFNGIRACVCALILDAVIKLGKKSVIDKWCVAICIVITLLSVFTSLSPVILVVLAAAAGISIKNIQKMQGEKK